MNLNRINYSAVFYRMCRPELFEHRTQAEADCFDIIWTD